jgi:hypothetical protein
LWTKDNRERVKEEYKIEGRMINGKCGKIWKSLTKEEKSPYQKQAGELKASNLNIFGSIC